MAATETVKLAEIIKNNIDEYGTSVGALSDLLDVALNALMVDNDVEYGFTLTKYIKNCCVENIKAGVDVYEMDDLYWRVMRKEAPYSFDSYLLYLEKNREPKEAFYKPKRKQLNKHGLIQALQDMEDDKLDLLSISMPPGTQKTTLEKFFLSWVIGKHPEDYNLFFSHSRDITRMFYDGVLDITTNDDEYTWGEIFPDVRVSSTDALRECINFNKYKPYANLQCSSVGAKNAGKVRCNRYLCCDDLIGGIEEALNNNLLDKLWRVYSTDARQRKLNEQVKEIHIATRWSVHDVIGRLQEIYQNNDRVRFISVPDIDPQTGESNFDYDYNGMSVAFFHDQELMMDEISYKCLYKNEPVEREGLLYTEDAIRRYRELPDGEPDAILSIADTKNTGTDYFFQPCFYLYGEDYFLVDCICSDNADYGIQYERSADLILKYHIQQCQFESNNGGDRVSLEVQKLVEARGGACNFTTKYTTSNKETKIIVNADWVKKHILFKDSDLYSVKDDYGVMMGWLLRYTTAGKNIHDDVPDGLASFAVYAAGYGIVTTEIVNSPF